MNPPSMETIFLLLSGVILFAGVIYWLWSHIQLTQKKVQLLENAVFELRALIPGGGTAGPPVAIVTPTPASTPVSLPPTKSPSAYTDLADDDWSDDVGSSSAVAAIPTVSTPLDAVVAPIPLSSSPLPELITRETEIPNDLMPGGRIQLEESLPPLPASQPTETTTVADDAGSVVSSLTAEEKFKKILSGRNAAEAPALEGMPLKELRRLGEQRGIHGAMEMRKKELLAALRSTVIAAKKEEPEEQGGTLDLATVDESALAADIVEPAPEAELVDL